MGRGRLAYCNVLVCRFSMFVWVYGLTCIFTRELTNTCIYGWSDRLGNRGPTRFLQCKWLAGRGRVDSLQATAWDYFCHVICYKFWLFEKVMVKCSCHEFIWNSYDYHYFSVPNYIQMILFSLHSLLHTWFHVTFGIDMSELEGSFPNLYFLYLVILLYWNFVCKYWFIWLTKLWRANDDPFEMHLYFWPFKLPNKFWMNR